MSIFLVILCVLLCSVTYWLAKGDERDSFDKGYRQAVRDIIRYGIYYDEQQNMKHVDIIRDSVE